MSAGLVCHLLADGVRVADGSPGDDIDDPTALSGLRVIWGRSTTVDQPDASTASFQLMDSFGGRAVRDVLVTGTRIDITATGTTFPDPNVSTFLDPGMEAAPANLTALSGVASTGRSTVHAHSGTYSQRLSARAAGGLAATFAPAPFAPAGTDPAAWDAIPQTAIGQHWQIGVWVWAPVGVQVTLAVALFTGPYETAALARGPLVTHVGTGAWQQLAATFTPALADCWVGITVTSGAMTTWDAQAGTWDAQAGTWDDHGTIYVDDIATLAPAEGTDRTVLVFSGRVTNLESSWPDGSPAPLVDVTAADFTADLANRDVGDVPWVVETMAQRVARIIALADPGLPVTIAPTVSAIPVSWRDVDSQPATGLLAELGTSVDAVMWAATHPVSGPYLDYEDPATRPPDQVLELVGGIVELVPSMANALPISSCDIGRDGVRWTQDVSDVVSRAAITWLVQGVDEDGLPTTTESTLTLIDSEREVDGVRRYGVSTQLTTEADASNVAGRILARTALGWRASGVVIEDSTQIQLSAEQMLTLLDGTARNGLAVALLDVPDWAPTPGEVGLYLEGGTYTFADGWWDLELTVSSAHGSGTSVTWNGTPPAWRWNDFDPDIAWDDLAGVGVAS